jgi:hypothetical protein
MEVVTRNEYRPTVVWFCVAQTDGVSISSLPQWSGIYTSNAARTEQKPHSRPLLTADDAFLCGDFCPSGRQGAGFNVDVSRASGDVDKQARDAFFISASAPLIEPGKHGIEIELSFSSLERNDAG